MPDLFGEEVVLRRAPRDLWVGGGNLFGDGRNGHWTHPALPAVQVRHCGHQTALRPYYIVATEQAACKARNESWKGTFRGLAQAKLAALEAFA